MSWFEEVKPFFLIIRLHGLAPYSFVDGSPSESKSWRIYSHIIILVRLFEMFFIPYVLSNTECWNFRMLILMVGRSAMSACSFITENIVCCRTFKELKTMIDLVDDYDRSLGINFATKFRAFRTWSSIAVSTLYISFIVATIPVHTVLQKCVLVHVIIKGSGWFAMVLKFGAIVNSFERRFEHLSAVMKAGTPSVVYDANGSSTPLRLNDVSRLHSNLVSAARIFNSMHNMVLSFWIGESTFYIVSKIYRLMSNAVIFDFHNIGKAIVNTTPDIVILVYILASCHGASEAANKVGRVALSPSSSVVRGRFQYERDEGFFIGHYFETNLLQFTAAYGFIEVELPLLATIFGGVTTISVVLVS